ncbi:division/cell wall cluster transcriptional repressor MraZ [Motilibacter sp. K478]|nr:division/cell wall cluster transcriptional repressor MraZ [Motilibacter aurantiacus]NHC45569.1 division/cell wall cluster transcriptional repressor MraZ [Motilibacter aurantiacus]
MWSRVEHHGGTGSDERATGERIRFLGRSGRGGGGVEPLFLGTHTPRLDEKGRLFLPAKFRDGLAEGLVMTKGQEGCVTVWPVEQFRRVADAMAARPFTDRESRVLQRLFLSDAVDDVPDKQGRVTVPPVLRQHAGLDRDVVVVGMNKRVEIWDSARWQQFQEQEAESFERLAEEVLPGLL